MTDADMTQREKIVKSMKKSFKDFRKRYGARAKEVMYATATKMAMKESVDEADKGEYDYEGDMAKSSLKTIIRNAQLMHDMLGEDTNLPEWVQGKITLAEDYLVSAAQYMQSEMSEEVKLEEGSYNPEPARASTKKRIVKKGQAGRERNTQQYMKNMMLPRSQRKSAPIKGTDKHGNKNVKHVSGPYIGEETIDELKHSTVSSAVVKRASRLANVERDDTMSPENKKVLSAYHKKKLSRNAKHELVHDMPNLRKMMYKEKTS